MFKFVMVLFVSAVLFATVSPARADEPTREESVNALRLADNAVVATQVAMSFGNREFFRHVVVGVRLDERKIIFKVYGTPDVLTERFRTAITAELRREIGRHIRGYRMEVVFIPRAAAPRQ